MWKSSLYEDGLSSVRCSFPIGYPIPDRLSVTCTLYQLSTASREPFMSHILVIFYNFKKIFSCDECSLGPKGTGTPREVVPQAAQNVLAC